MLGHKGYYNKINCCFLSFGDSPASEFYMPTFWNTVSSIFVGSLSRKKINCNLI